MPLDYHVFLSWARSAANPVEVDRRKKMINNKATTTTTTTGKVNKKDELLLCALINYS
jgi:hypothetical protein